MLRMIRVAAAATLAAFSAAAGPRSIADCENIQAADAYNQCLASFGPVASGHKALPYAETTEARVGAPAARVTLAKNRRGRARIVLTPRQSAAD
ncbi:hypothetical protein K3F48_07355 [Methylosinus sp. Sm6]|nr:hypothetical protein [Methylosinus sp. Sm6]